jgi:hypothetical protein
MKNIIYNIKIINQMSKNVKKYLFVLKNINIEKVNSKYGIHLSIEETILDNPEVTTKLSELNTERCTPDAVSFLDESKRSHVCSLSMIDFESKMNINLLRYHCFWCKNPFETKPIGCPVNYISNQAIKRYHSHISKDTYTIKENITSSRKNNLDENISLNKGEYYETDGVFCSFNCCKAYINDSKHIRLYDKSDMLLTKMYNEMTGTKSIIISPAPHWRTLEQYGGQLNILKFRESFNNIDYECHGNTKNIPVFIPLGTLFEEKIKF